MIIWDNLKIQNSNYTFKLTPIVTGLKLVDGADNNASITLNTLHASGLDLSSSNNTSLTWGTSGLTVGGASTFNGIAKFTSSFEMNNSGQNFIVDAKNLKIASNYLSIHGATFSTTANSFTKAVSATAGVTISSGAFSVTSTSTLANTIITGKLTTQSTVDMRYNNNVPRCYPGVILSEAYNDDMYILPVLPPSSVSSAKMYISWKHKDGTKCTCTVSPSTDNSRPWINLEFDHRYDNTDKIDNYICHIDSIKVNTADETDRTITITYDGATETYVRSNTDWQLDGINTIGYCLKFNRNSWYPDSTSAGRWFADQNKSFTIIAPNKAWASGQGDDVAARRICYFMRGLMTLCGIQYFNSADVYYAHGSNTATRLFHKDKSTTSTHLTLRCDQVDNAMCQGTVMELFV